MANRKRDAGREALEKKGWWRSHRWLVLRRLCQFFVLGMFLSGPWFGVWILHGNYSSSLLFDTVPLTDPLMTLQSLASGHLPATVALTGAVIITVLYALAGKRLFCSWVCPLNPITDLANWLRRRFDLNQSATIPRHIRYVLLVVILLGSALTGTLIWEWINPVSLMGRSLVMGFGSGAEKDGRRGHNLCEADKECKWQGIQDYYVRGHLCGKQEGHKQGLYGKKLYHKEDDSDTERGGNYI